MIFNRFAKRLSVVFFANFVVGSVLPSNGIFATNTFVNRNVKSVTGKEDRGQSVGKNGSKTREKKASSSKRKMDFFRGPSVKKTAEIKGKSIPGESNRQDVSVSDNIKDNFERTREYVENFLEKKKCLKIAEKDEATQWTIAYFYGMLEERINNGKDVKDLEELKVLKEKVDKYLNYSYKQISSLRKKERQEFRVIRWLKDSFYSILGLNYAQPESESKRERADKPALGLNYAQPESESKRERADKSASK